MKKYLFTCLVCLSILAISCAQKPNPDPEIVSEGSPETQPEPQAAAERILPSQLPTIAYPTFITGETTYNSELKPEAWFSRPVEKPHLGSIVKPGEVPHMIAFGGGLTAGVSNGGLNREAQQFAYPNLVARQMGISDFKTPLLPENEANGTGIFLYEDINAEYPRWHEVTNNLAKLEPGKPVKMTPYEGVIHNFAFPYGGTIGATYDYCPTCKTQAFASRFSSYKVLADSNLLNAIRKKHDYDFVIMEDFTDSFVNWIVYQDRMDGSFSLAASYSDPTYAMDKIVNAGQKGVVFTIPHFRDLGFMNWYGIEALKNRASSLSIVYWANNKAFVSNASENFYLKPTKNVEGTFLTAEKKQPIQAQLKDLDVVDEGETFFANPNRSANPYIRKCAQKHNLAIVDLCAIYERIHAGTYITDYGLKIDGSMKGNFFSSDGIYPTPLGQAVIANEVIKAINDKYGSKIPTINVTEFLQTTSSK